VRRMLLIATLNPLADGILLFGLPWIVLSLGRSVAEAAALSTVSSVSYIATGAFSGAAGNRLGHRRTVRVSLGLQTATAIVVGAALLSHVDAVPLLLGLSFAIGAGRAFIVTSTYAATSTVIDSARMPIAFAHLTVAREIGFFGGPAIGAVIYGIGHTQALVFAVIFACGIAWLTSLNLSGSYRTRFAGSRLSIRRRMVGVVGDRHMRLLLLSGFVWNLYAGAALTLDLPLMHNQIHLSSFGTGVVLAAGVLGSFAVAPMMRVLGGNTNLTRLTLRGIAAQAGTFILLSTIVNVAFLIPVYALMMMSNTTVESNLQAARAQKVPPARQATVVGVGMFVSNTGAMVGGGFAVLLSSMFTLPQTFFLLGVSMVGLAALMWLLLISPGVRLRHTVPPALRDSRPSATFHV
jgi:MFS family permease